MPTETCNHDGVCAHTSYAYQLPVTRSLVVSLSSAAGKSRKPSPACQTVDLPVVAASHRHGGDRTRLPGSLRAPASLLPPRGSGPLRSTFPCTDFSCTFLDSVATITVPSRATAATRTLLSCSSIVTPSGPGPASAHGPYLVCSLAPSGLKRRTRTERWRVDWSLRELATASQSPTAAGERTDGTA